ncbi:MAG: YggT family protein, partial [Acetobacter syzygii]
TPDLLIANEALSHLSYSPACFVSERFIGLTNFLSSCIVRRITIRWLAFGLFVRSWFFIVFLLFMVLTRILEIYCWILLVSCIFVNLYAFGILDSRNQLVWKIGMFLERLTEPVLAPVRRILPTPGGVDFSPMVVLLGIQYVLQPLLVEVFRALILH